VTGVQLQVVEGAELFVTPRRAEPRPQLAPTGNARGAWLVRGAGRWWLSVASVFVQLVLAMVLPRREFAGAWRGAHP